MEKSTNIPKYTVIADIIRHNIAGGTYDEGALIPTEKEIAESNDVSLITVKKAVSILIDEGLLERISGKKGTFVVKQDQNKDRSNLIGVAIDDISEIFGSQILRGIEDKLWEEGYHSVVCSSDRNFEKVKGYFNSLMNNDISGILFAPVIGNDFIKYNLEILDSVIHENIPYVLLDRSIPGITSNSIMPDHRKSGQLITERLVSSGNERILVIYSANCTSMMDRIAGFRDIMEQKGLSIDEKQIICVDDNNFHNSIDRGEYSRLERFIENAGDFTAVYALNERLLSIASEIIESNSEKFSDKIVYAVNDEDYTTLPKGIKSILHTKQNRYEIGRKAAELLLEQIKSPYDYKKQLIFDDDLIEPVSENQD